MRAPWVPEEGPQRLSSGHHMHTHTQTPTHKHIHTDHNCHPLLTSRAVFWAIHTVKVFAGFKIALLEEHPLSISMLQLGEMGLRAGAPLILGDIAGEAQQASPQTREADTQMVTRLSSGTTSERAQEPAAFGIHRWPFPG